ncbi:hypothetical protein [Actibacterium sp. MT2.3-13A]|uniref:hypothetical protein n=1 Tax=Actibacterium sp. MT2.3-13A TaxID=2828332 RepID=UPI001BA7BD35|nr:hypothetical protein [Actibacterium sp. MT2.3-13A]
MRVYLILLAFAVAVWAFCGAIMGLGRAVTTLETTLLLHAIGAPLAAAVAAWGFQRLRGGVAPVSVAAAFVATALFLDAFLVAPVFEGSFEMFRSVIGLWLPQALIFLAAWGAGNAGRRTSA